jgi:bacillithiol biosynthesis cysteine-adding enzyme BshC
LANDLFSNYGLLVLGMDDRRLKSSFIPIMEKELLEMPSRGIVMETQTKLEKAGFSSQAYPRIINLFYLQDNLRSRIEKGGDKEYYVVDTNIQWSEEELLVELHEYPERFSPNVIMRPLYQEHTLPNLAYIGGGGEIAYWLERKDQFEFFKIPFPILMRRNSAMLVPTYIQDQINDLELDITTFFGDEDLIINNFLAEQTTIEIDLAEEKKDLEKVFDKIAWKAEQIDPPLAKWILAESTKNQKLVDQMESRIRRSIKKREENKVKQIRKVKNKLFPGNGLQERYDNFFQYYLEEGPSLIEKLIETFDPVSNDFYMIKL